MSSDSKTTTDHNTIRRWTEERGGRPAAVAATHKADDPGILRIAFDGSETQEALEEISWEEFFRKFEESKLAFLYQTETSDGQTSRFFKFIQRSG